MANMTTTGTSDYPASLDTRTDLADGSSGDEILSRHPDGLGAAVIAVETELGVDPAGSATDVVTRLGVAHNAAGAVTLGTAASVVGVLPLNRGGLGLTAASGTFTNGFIPIVGNSVLQLAGLTAGAGITVTPASGSITVALTSTAKLSGDTVQWRRVQVVGFTTTNGFKANDNTPFTSSAGSNFGLSVDILPTNTANTIYAQFQGAGTGSLNSFVTWGLFLAASTSAVAAWTDTGAAENLCDTFGSMWHATTVSTATTTYAIRIGGAGAGTFTLNGQSGAGLHADSLTSSLTVWEVQN